MSPDRGAARTVVLVVAALPLVGLSMLAGAWLGDVLVGVSWWALWLGVWALAVGVWLTLDAALWLWERSRDRRVVRRRLRALADQPLRVLPPLDGRWR